MKKSSAAVVVVAAAALGALLARESAAQEFCRNATHCVCSSADFAACVVPAAQEGLCTTEGCSGWICDCDGSEICRYAATDGYAVSAPGTGGPVPCSPTMNEYVAPAWAFIMPSQFFCGDGCVALLGTTADIAANSELAGDSAAYIYVNLAEDKQVVAAMNGAMETGPGCAAGTTNVIQRVHLHLSPDPANNANGPIKWTICDNNNPDRIPCPTMMSGSYGTYPAFYSGTDLDSDFATLQASPGSYYANFHTSCAPGGVIRGFLSMMNN